MCLKIQHLKFEKCLSEPRLTCVAALKDIEAKLELLTNIDMLLMLKKESWRGIFYLIHQYENGMLIINISKIMIRIKNHPILNTGM